jgi:hypothetical protein
MPHNGLQVGKGTTLVGHAHFNEIDTRGRRGANQMSMKSAKKTQQNSMILYVIDQDKRRGY